MRTIKKSNFRVEIYPKTHLQGFKLGDEEESCKQIVEDVKRHVDNVQWTYVVCDENMVCKFCGQSWTTDNDTYNGGCCDKDQEAQPKEAGDELLAIPGLKDRVRKRYDALVDSGLIHPDQDKEAGDET